MSQGGMRLGGKVSNYSDEQILVRIDGGVNEEQLGRRVKKYGHLCEIIMLDKRRITTEQRRKAYAMINEIAEYQGELDTEGKKRTKYFLKGKFLEEFDYKWFSLSDCSVELAYNFVDFLVAFCMEHRIPTRDMLRNRYEDIEKYLYNCLKYGVCAVCGDPGLAHHIDAFGMGVNRKTTDDSQKLKICLCSKMTNNRQDGTEGSCHDLAHRLGWTEFSKKYIVKGILFNGRDKDE